MNSDLSLIALLTLATLLPFLIASGTCFIKISIVLMIVRNALGLQQVPSNMALNGIALLLSLFVMMPVVEHIYRYAQEDPPVFASAASLERFVDNGLGEYRDYLQKYADPTLVRFFENARVARESNQQGNGDRVSLADDIQRPSLFVLLPAYALSEIKSAFRIGFYLYLPFVVVDLVISSILLALGMMMMSPVTVSTPIKLVLFVAMDGWTLLSQGLVSQYLPLSQ